ncbi:MAG TPA: GYF domain-containing protein, partial [Anaeromyxobacteraceae bacterium]
AAAAAPAPAPGQEAPGQAGPGQAGPGAEPAGGQAPAAAGPGNEWYVAVDDQQVGPLAAPAVKGKWESGEIGPDTLVWKPGLDDWKPLSQVPELQRFLSPVPRPAGRPRAAARPPPPGAVPAPTPAAPKEPDWKPSAASALAALASEEMAAMKAPAPAGPAPAAARPGGKGSLVDAMNLPDSGGVDPTGAIPLPIKGLSGGEARLERKSSVARTTAELRIKRSANRTIMGVAAVMLVLLAAGVGGVFWYFQQKIAPPPQAAAPATQHTFAPPIPVPAPQAAPQPPAPVPPPAAPAAAAPPASSQAAPRKKAAPPPAPAEKPAPKKVAQAEPPPSPAPRKKGSGDPFGGGGADDEFEKLLNEPPKRSVYVPPAPGGEVAEKVSTGQIQEAVAGKMGSLRDCLARQQATDPDAHGEVTVTWDIEPDGRPAAVSTGKAQNQPFAQCLVGVVKSIRFPKSRLGNRGDDKIRFPFRY